MVFYAATFEILSLLAKIRLVKKITLITTALFDLKLIDNDPYPTRNLFY